MPTTDADVAIVGGGPVGTTLAILLAQLGHRVTVLERWPEPYGLPRAVHFDHEVARIFQSCGIGARLSAITEPAHVYEWRNAAGTTLLRFGRLGDSSSGWPESLMFSQPDLQTVLDERSRELSTITVHRDADVSSLEETDNGVQLHTTNDTTVTARFVVGCDGANSTVRSLLGIEMVDLGFFYDWLIVDVLLHETRVFDPINVQICDPKRPTTAVSGGPGRRRWEFMRLPHETTEELNDESCAWQLLAPWDVTPHNARLERHAVYTFNARYAPQWRRGSVFLAGDAAHLMPPFAGQGMCAGIRDAANLAWKLDAVLKGSANTELLDSYQEERMPSAQSAITFSMELGKVICISDEDEARQRDDAMASAVGSELVEVPPLAPLARGIIHPDDQHAGRLFVQGDVNGLPFDDVHGAGWRLVTIDNDVAQLDPSLCAWFASIGGKIVTLGNPDPTYARWFSHSDMTYVLQRPDFYIFGAATDASGAADVLHSLRYHLTQESLEQGVPS